jgi:hypothetical protein
MALVHASVRHCLLTFPWYVLKRLDEFQKTNHSDTGKNQSKRLDFDNTINLSSLIVNLVKNGRNTIGSGRFKYMFRWSLGTPSTSHQAYKRPSRETVNPLIEFVMSADGPHGTPRLDQNQASGRIFDGFNSHHFVG